MVNKAPQNHERDDTFDLLPHDDKPEIFEIAVALRVRNLLGVKTGVSGIDGMEFRLGPVVICEDRLC